MSRTIKDWKPELVADATVAPHRYLWSGAILPDGSEAKLLDLCDDWREIKANIPYLEGEVVYLAGSPTGPFVKARIIHRMYRRNYHGDRVEYYKVQTETKKGLWSKNWIEAHPGFIQRGYYRAGLAPDMEGLAAQCRDSAK